MYKIISLFMGFYLIFSVNNTFTFISMPIEEQVFNEINNIRVENNLAKFEYDEKLSKLAREKSTDLATTGEFSHTSKNYGTTKELLLKYPYPWLLGGENISRGGESAIDIVNAFVESPDHKANILNPKFNKSGIGCFIKEDGTIYLTELFIDSIF